MKTKYKRERLNSGSELCKGYIITTVSDDKCEEPCFHIIDTETLGKNYDCCISLQNATLIKGDSLTKALKRSMLKWLDRRVRNCFKTSTISGWKDLCFDWVAGNYDFTITRRRPRYEEVQTK